MALLLIIFVIISFNSRNARFVCLLGQVYKIYICLHKKVNNFSNQIHFSNRLLHSHTEKGNVFYVMVYCTLNLYHSTLCKLHIVLYMYTIALFVVWMNDFVYILLYLLGGRGYGSSEMYYNYDVCVLFRSGCLKCVVGLHIYLRINHQTSNIRRTFLGNKMLIK